MSLLLLLPGNAASISGAGGIVTAEEFGAVSLDFNSQIFTASSESYFAVWGKHPVRSARRESAGIKGAGGIKSAEAFGRPTIFAQLQAEGFSAITVVGHPVIRKGFILQDEEFFLLAA